MALWVANEGKLKHGQKNMAKPTQFATSYGSQKSATNVEEVVASDSTSGVHPIGPVSTEQEFPFHSSSGIAPPSRYLPLPGDPPDSSVHRRQGCKIEAPTFSFPPNHITGPMLPLGRTGFLQQEGAPYSSHSPISSTSENDQGSQSSLRWAHTAVAQTDSEIPLTYKFLQTPKGHVWGKINNDNDWESRWRNRSFHEYRAQSEAGPSHTNVRSRRGGGGETSRSAPTRRRGTPSSSDEADRECSTNSKL